MESSPGNNRKKDSEKQVSFESLTEGG